MSRQAGTAKTRPKSRSTALMSHQSPARPVRDAPASLPRRVEVRRPAVCPRRRRSVPEDPPPPPPPLLLKLSRAHAQRPPLISGRPEPACRSRRCLAKALIDKALLSQPQDRNCTQVIAVPFMEYQTLSVVGTAGHLFCSTPCSSCFFNFFCFVFLIGH